MNKTKTFAECRPPSGAGPVIPIAATALPVYARCGRAYNLVHRARKRGPLPPEAQDGVRLHDACKHLAWDLKRGQTPDIDRATRLSAPPRLYNGREDDTYPPRAHAVLSGILAFLRAQQIDDIVAIEETFYGPPQDVPGHDDLRMRYLGRPDLVAKVGGGYVIYDVKTGAQPLVNEGVLQEDLASYVYHRLVSDRFGSDHNHMSIVHVAPHLGVYTMAHLTEEHLSRGHEAACAMAVAIARDAYTATTNPSCQWCPVIDGCEAHASQGGRGVGPLRGV